MTDPDLKFAILLQKQFDNELPVVNNDDKLLASILQNQFNQEYQSEKSMGLSYETNNKKTKDGGKSLVDPSWEFVDPTPNIHNLFVVFNQQFFWNKLQTVCVSWSKRMTMCAGICSYQGHGGMCQITLSEPLLKLRPRKDLVETLLHEMIHAFLFITNNNRDRDGHGPEFHKHMYRINNEAGTNITVYHDFHEEVKLYQTHWWRCNGPCQNYKPYFGMVKRAVNRPPGPNDFWWNEHQRRCGGSFIKVREPEKKKPVTRQKSITTPALQNNTLKNFVTTSINVMSNTSTPKKSPNKSTKLNKPIISPNSDIRSFFVRNTSSGSNTVNKSIQTINNTNGVNPKIAAVFNKGNIHGFKNLGTNGASKVSKNLNNTDFNKINKNNKGFVGIKSNNSNTVVVTSQQKSNNLPKPEENVKVNNQVFSGTGRVLSSTSNTTTDSSDHYNKVREHWQKKYNNSKNNNNNLSNNKRVATDEITSQNKKHQKTKGQVVLIDDEKLSNLTTCPICNQKFSAFMVEKHVDKCLTEQFKEDKPEKNKQICCICNKEVPHLIYKEHLKNCFNDSVEDDGLSELIECPICDSYFDKSIIEKHTNECIEKNFKIDSMKNSDNNELINKSNGDKNKSDLIECNVCSVLVESSKYNIHVEKCLHNLLDNIEEKYDIPCSNTKVNCLVCKKEILKSELNAHLDDCMSGVFDEKLPDGTSKQIPNGIDDNVKPSCSKDRLDNDYKYNCPFCLDLYSELDMSGHLKECLQSDNETSPDKANIIDSFSSDDF